MNAARLAMVYAKSSLKAAARRPALAADLLRYCLPWMRSMADHPDPFAQERPWIPFAAAAFLDRFLTPSAKVFEYGSGASTLYFARMAGVVHSVEHDRDWFGRVAQAIADRGFPNCRHDLVEPAENSQSGPCPFGYRGSGRPGLSFERYVRSIESHEDGELDLVLVDGRSRNAAIWHARSKVAPGGILLLDNSEREAYRPGMDVLGGWERRDFFGPCPGVGYFLQATAFRKPPR